MTKLKNNYSALLLSAFGMFTLTVAIIFIVHVVTGVSEPTFRYSISTYVGRKIWSSVLYMINSCYVSFALIRFLFSEKIPKVFRYFGMLVIISFLMVSLFPFGLINESVNLIHNIFAQVVLLSLVFHTMIGAICFRRKPKCIFPNLICLTVDAIVIVIALGVPKLFWSYPFLFEFVLLFAYFASLLTLSKITCDDREKVSMVS